MFGRSLRRCPPPLRWKAICQRSYSYPLQSSMRSQPESSKSMVRSLQTSARLFQQTAQYAPAAEAAIEQDLAASRPPSDEQVNASTSMGPVTRFTELNNLVNPAFIHNITRKMGLETMTQVQSLTINEALKGVDILARAKTGTGKTIGFLLPLLQRIMERDPALQRPQRPSRRGTRHQDIRGIVISPTRELAEQIAEEARRLTAGTGIVVQVAVGGTQKRAHLRQMMYEGCHLLVATPGRLKDILTDPEAAVAAPQLGALVLDEADRLMDDGFWPEIEEIVSYLPNIKDVDRQTMLFSATIPHEVVDLARSIMKRDFLNVQTVQENEQPTHERVTQNVVTVPSIENLLPATLELCAKEIKASQEQPGKRPFKAIVYFNATAETTLSASIFFNTRKRDGQDEHLLRDCRVFEIHSKLSQAQRTAAADRFRKANSGILMSSDVTARGMDFPDVTHVIQVGVPQQRDTYIHRIGRTARAGKEGEGWLLFPSVMLNDARQRLGKLPLKRNFSLETANVDFTKAVAGGDPEGMTETSKRVWDAVQRASRGVRDDEKRAAYVAALGTWQSFRNKEWLIGALNRMAKHQWGMHTPPAIGAGLVQKLGLTRVAGLNIDRSPRPASSSGSRGFSRSPGPFGGRGQQQTLEQQVGW